MDDTLTGLISRGYPAHNVRVREALVLEAVTLNGKPARISGPGRKFATVTGLGDRLGCEFSWAAAMHVVQHGGRFES